MVHDSYHYSCIFFFFLYFRELHAATGEWIYEATSVTANRLVGDKKNSPVDILKRSIRRAWTINGEHNKIIG